MFNEKTRVAIFSLGLVLTLTVGAAFAYYFQKLAVTNHFKTGDIGIGLTESCDYEDGWVPGEEKINEVYFDNTGDYDVLIRAKFYPEVSIGENKVDNKAVVEGFNLNFTQNFNNTWIKMDDGWFYYKQVLKTHATTPITLKSVTMSDRIGNTNKDGAHEDYSMARLKILVDCESIQTQAHADEFEASGWKTPLSIQEDKVIWK